MQPFLALITPLTEPPGGGGGGGGGQPPLGIWGPTDPRPTFPISGWNPGTGNFPEQPPTGGGGQPPVPSHPIAGGPWPTHPIFFPPGTRPPGQGGPMPPQPGQPPGIWGPNDPRPTLPIAGWNPGTGNFPEGPGGGGGESPEPKFEMKTAWSQQTGWIVIFVPAEGTLVPTPSKEGSESGGEESGDE